MAITRVGSASASTTSVTVPAHVAGDLILVFAFRDSATTAPPTLPTGYTSIRSTTQAGAALLCFKIATSTSDTATGFTNATGLLCVVYRSTTNGILAVGTSAVSNGTANTGVTIPALTLQATDGTSAVIACMGHRSIDQGLSAKSVTGLTEFLDLTDATDELTAWDHVGNTSFGSTSLTMTGTASGWVAYSLEILDAGGQWNTTPFSGGAGTFSNSNRTNLNAGSAVIINRLSKTAPLTAVTVQDISTADTLVDAATSANHTTLTVTAGSNQALLATLSFSLVGTTAPSGVTAVWDNGGTNQSMTAITAATKSANDGTQTTMTMLFGLLAPTLGSKTLHISWTTAATCYVDAVSLINVIQTSIATAFTNGAGATGTGAAPSLVVTSATNDLVLTAWASRGGVSAQYNSVDHTQLFRDATGAVGNGAANYSAGAATVTMGAVQNAAGLWTGSGVNVHGGFTSSLKVYGELTAAASLAHDSQNFSISNAANTSWIACLDIGGVESSTELIVGSCPPYGASDVVAFAADIGAQLVWFKNLTTPTDSAFLTIATTGGITFSNTNHTATATATNSAVQAHGSVNNGGLKYFEIKFPTIGPSGVNFNVGSLDGNSWIFLGQDGSMGTNYGGTFTSLPSIDGYTAGLWVQCAINFSTQKIWLRTPGSANLWNNSGTANPATGVGGIAFTNQGGNAINVFMADSGSVATINLGDTTFVGTVPSGFTAWNFGFGGWNNDDISVQDPANGIGGFALPTVNPAFITYFANTTSEGWTLNTGTAAFTGTVPSGFSSWFSFLLAQALTASMRAGLTAKSSASGVVPLAARVSKGATIAGKAGVLASVALQARTMLSIAAKATSSLKAALFSSSRLAIFAKAVPLVKMPLSANISKGAAVAAKAGIAPLILLSAKAAMTIRSGATIAGKTALSASSRIVVFAKGMTTPFVIALFATATTRLMGKASIAGKTALSASSRVAVFGKITTLAPVIALFANAAMRVMGKASAVGTTALSSSTRIAIFTKINAPGAIALLATMFVRMMPKAGVSGTVPLSARTVLTLKAAPAAKYSMALAAIGRVTTAIKAGAGFTANLAATSRATVKGGASGTFTAVMAAASRISVRGAASPAGRVALAAASRVAVVAKGSIAGGAQLVALAGRTTLAVTVKASITATSHLVAVAGQSLIKITVKAAPLLFKPSFVQIVNTKTETRVVDASPAGTRIASASTESRVVNAPEKNE